MTQEEKKNLVLAIIENAKARYQFPVFVFGDSIYYLDEAENAMLEYMEDDMAHDNLTQEQYFDRQVACAKSLTVEELITGTYDSETPPQYLLDNFKMMLRSDTREEEENVVERYDTDENGKVVAYFEDDYGYDWVCFGWDAWDGTRVALERTYTGVLNIVIDAYQYGEHEINPAFLEIIKSSAPVEYEPNYEAVADDIIDYNDGCAFLLDRCRGFANEWGLYIVSKCDAEEVKSQHLERYGMELEELNEEDNRLELEDLIVSAIKEYGDDYPEENYRGVYIGYKH